ncbi:SUN domain-containing ossification factor [Schistosoma japonicum]|nr:SUN domain-containing ossification factor [Schistosoma japonicum]
MLFVVSLLYFSLLYSLNKEVDIEAESLNGSSELRNLTDFVDDRTRNNNSSDNANHNPKDKYVQSRKYVEFSPSVGASTDESILPTSTQSESAKPDHEVVRESFLKEFPSLDSVAAEGINTHEIPTFNEFHAMISEGSRSRKDQDCEAQNVDVLNSKYDTKTEQEINSAPSSIISEKLPQTHIDTNPSVKSSKGQLVQEVLDRAVLSDSGSSSDVIVTDPSSDQHQPLKGNSIVTSNAEINPKSSSHVTPQPVTTSATTTTRTVADNDALHTPSKMDLTLRRNVASVACGAKMLGSSKAIKNPEAVLNENNDEYMNVPCSEDKWLILEVCQPVQLRTIELANFELFSSRLKSFRVYANDRYPAKSWELIGTFTARDVKGIQSFSVISGKMIKYIKFELIEHYGSEHYCPLTMIRIFGLGSDDLDDDDDVDDIDVRLMNVPDTSSNHESIITSTNGGDQQQSENETTTLDYDHAKNNHKDGRTQQDTLSGSTSGTMEQTEEKRNHIQSSVSYHNEVNLSTHDDQATKKINSDSTMKSSHLNPLSDEHHSNNHNDDGDELSTGSNISSSMHLSTSSHTDVTSNHHQSSDIKNHDKYKLTTTDRQNIEHQSSNNNKNDTTNNNNKFCGKVGPVKLFGTEFCPAETVHPSMIHINNNDYSVSDKKSRFSPMTDTKMPTETKLPHVVRIKQPNNYPLQNKSTLNLTSQLSSELFNEVVNEMSLFSRLSSKHNLKVYSFDKMFALMFDDDAIKRTLFNTISLFYPSTQDHSGNYLNLHDIVPTSENFHTINYLFNPHGFSNLLCKGSMMYLTVDQIEGLWHLRKCLILLDHHQQRQQSSIDSQSLPVDPINPTNLDACSRACFKLPSFLLSIKHSESLSSSTSPHGSHLVDSTDNDVDDEKVLIGDYHHSADIVISSKNVKSSKSLSSSSSSSPIKSHNTNHPHSREALVVPAALSGSRKSTAFMRLNNRVRIIERNVSVSMRYLEELSQSYRRQMERLSRSFNLTYAWLKVTAQSADERDRQQQHRITQLELQLNDFIARFKPLLLNSPSSSNQEELTSSTSLLSSTTATPTTTTSSSSSSETAPANLGSTATISATPKTSNLVSTSLSPPPLPDFENSLDWNPWFKSQHDDWNTIVDGDAVMFGLVFLHLTLASIVHFLIYWVWLRPKSHMLSTKFDTDLLLSSLFRVLCCNNKSHHQKYGNLVLYFNPISSTSSSPTTHLLPSTNTSTTINTNLCTTDNLTGCDTNQNDDKNQSLIKESNTIRHNTTINSNIDDNLRPKSFTCCQLNDLFHAYKSSIEINHNHLFKKVHQNSIISVYDQCTIDNVDSCCLTKKNEGDRIQDSDLLSNQDLANYNGALMHQPFILNKCRPQHAQSCSSAQSPTYCLPSESSQFSKDKLKYEENGL